MLYHNCTVIECRVCSRALFELSKISSIEYRITKSIDAICKDCEEQGKEAGERKAACIRIDPFDNNRPDTDDYQIMP